MSNLFYIVSWEEEDEKEADEAAWTLAELEHLLNFINNSLVMTFPLYIVCKHNHICALEVGETLSHSLKNPVYFNHFIAFAIFQTSLMFKADSRLRR